MTNKTKWIAITLGLANAVAQATPIDGWTPQAYLQNQTLLKSVIRIESGMFFNTQLCSSTLISKNILLTAKHCVVGFEAGTRIALNGNPIYEVVEVVQQEKIVAQKTATTATEARLVETSTDMALVLFKSIDCKDTSLSGVQPIAIANSSNQRKLSNRVLIAGYGKTSPNSEDAGTLHAGYNEWVVSDYSQVKDEKLANALRQIMRDIKVPEDSLILNGSRKGFEVFDNVVGRKISRQATGIAMPNSDEQALPLPGDSGSAAIAFDEKNNPFIVGVTSMAAPSLIPQPVVILLVDPQLPQPLLQLPVNGVSGLSEGTIMSMITKMLTEKLLESKYIDEKYTVLKSFGVMRLSGRTGAGMYASVLNAANAGFIAAAHVKLKKSRDAANYCQ